jgi:hypothetical protein
MSQQSLNLGVNEFMHNGRGKSGRLNGDDYRRYCQKMKEIEACKAREAACNECVVETPCNDPCEDPCKNSYFDMGWLGMLLLWFIIFTVLFWLIFYSLQPDFVLNSDGSINTGKTLLAAIIAAILLVLVIWLIKSCISYSM